MKFTFSVFFTILIISAAFCEDQFTVDFYKITDGYVIYADNNELYAVSVKVDIDLKNMQSSKGNHKVFVIPPKVNNYEIKRVNILDNRKSSNFHVNTLAGIGDHTQTDYDYEYPYDLPYESKVTYTVMQVCSGYYSHARQYALDFNISAEYTHLSRASSKVRKRDHVTQVQYIASSGNVGWASGAHLHFEVFMMNLDKRIILPTKFKLSMNILLQELVEQESYKKKYQDK